MQSDVVLSSESSRAKWGEKAFSTGDQFAAPWGGGSNVAHQIRLNRGCVRHEFGFFSTTRDPRRECRQAITTKP